MEACQQGFQAKAVEWNYVARGFHHHPPRSMDEHHIRAFWPGWYRRMRADEETYAEREARSEHAGEVIRAHESARGRPHPVYRGGSARSLAILSDAHGLHGA